MDIDTTISRLTHLLELLPEVTVAWVRHSETLTRIGMQVTALESLACLAWINRGANVPFMIETDGGARPPPNDYESSRLRFDLRFPVQGDQEELPTRMQVFGILLARELKARGALSPQEVDVLHSAWNAIEREHE